LKLLISKLQLDEDIILSNPYASIPSEHLPPKQLIDARVAKAISFNSTRCIPQRCDTFSIAHATVDFMPLLTMKFTKYERDSNIQGSRAKYTCVKGAFKKNDVELTCNQKKYQYGKNESTRAWSDVQLFDFVKCVPLRCPNIQTGFANPSLPPGVEVYNVKIVFTRDESRPPLFDDRSWGATATYECFPGYVYRGQLNIALIKKYCHLYTDEVTGRDAVSWKDAPGSP
jgi:hypothetical protein